jgi:hypothetical protein
VEERNWRRDLDAVEGGGAHGAFYRARGGAEWTGWRLSSA